MPDERKPYIELGDDGHGGLIRFPVKRLPIRRNITSPPQKGLVGRNVRVNDITPRSVLALANIASLGRRWFLQGEEGTERCWYVDGIDTRFRGYLCLAPLQQSIALTGANAPQTQGVPWSLLAYQGSSNFLNEVIHGIYRFTSPGTGLPAADPTTGWAAAAQSANVLPATGLSSWPVIFKNQIFYPVDNGASTAYRYTGSPGGALTVGARAFTHLCPLGALLYGVSLSAGVYSLYGTTQPDDGATDHWVKVLDFTSFELNELPQKLFWGFSQDSQPQLFLATDRRVFQIDIPTAQATPMFRFPVRSYGTSRNFRDIVHWEKTRSMYFSDGGRNLWEMTPNVTRQIGPFSDDGLPSADSAFSMGTIIKGIFTSQNYLGVLVGMSAYTSRREAILLYDGIGWHCLDRSSGTDYTQSWDQAVFLGDTVVAYESHYNAGTVNHLVGWAVQDSKFQPWLFAPEWKSFAASGEIVLPWFDDDLPAINKIASEVSLEVLNVSANETISVYYQTDRTLGDDGAWTLLGTTASTPVEGKHSLPFASTGLAFDAIRFKITMARRTTGSNPERYTPVLRNMGFYFVIYPEPLFGYDTVIDCTGEFGGRTAAQLEDALFNLMASKQLHPCRIGRRGTPNPMYVLVSATQGSDSAREVNSEHFTPSGTFQATLFELRPVGSARTSDT